jgi:transposase
MLDALISGVDDPKALADLAQGRLRGKLPALGEALQGLMAPHQRTMLESHLRHLDFLDQEIERMDNEVDSRMRSLGLAAVILRRYWRRPVWT